MSFLQLGNEIILACGCGKDLGNCPFRRSGVNPFFGAPEASIYRLPPCELAKSRSLERIGDNLAVIVSHEIDKTVVLASVHPAVGRLTLHIIQ